MNRAQRRAAGKQAKRKPHRDRSIDPSSAWFAANVLMTARSTEPPSENGVAILMHGARQSLEAFTGGERGAPWASMDDFITLNEMNVLGFTLAGLLFKSAANQETRDALLPTEQVFTDCAARLVEIGERFGKTGKWGMSGDQRNAVMTSIGQLDNIISVSDQGYLLQALIDTKKQVAQYMTSKHNLNVE